MLLTVLSEISLFILVFCESTQHWKSTISSSTSYEFNFFWNECVGSGHGSLALREDWQQQLKFAHDKIGFSSVRFHGILDDDVGSVNGVNDYSFVNIDKIYDYLLSIDMKPYVEISFMPRDFASTSNTTFHYKGNISPPKDWNTWNDFIKQWMQHLIARYTIDVVSQWKFEGISSNYCLSCNSLFVMQYTVWNEPNCGFYVTKGCCGCDCPYYDEYMELYANTATSIKSVNSKLNVGGPSTAMLCWIDEFLNETQSKSLPVDFVSTHLYPQSKIINETGVNGFYNALKIAGQKVSKYKDLKVYLSEFNSGLYKEAVDNHDTNYAASFMIFQAAKLQPLISDYNYGWLSYWTFTDIFEEGGFGSPPFHNEYGMMTIRGIQKPVFRALQLLKELGSTIAFNTSRLDANNDNSTVQCYLLQNAKSEDRFAIFAANWNENGSVIVEERLLIDVEGNGQSDVPKSALLYRIDGNNVNPVSKWNNMENPMYPNQNQLNALNESSQFVTQSITINNVNANTVQFNVSIPAYGVIVIDIQY